MTRRRRASPIPEDAIVAPAWQRWLFGLFMVALGIVLLVISMADLRHWLAGLGRGDAVIETNSSMLAMPSLGLCFLLLAGLAPLGHVTVQRRERLMNGLFAIALAFGALGLVLALVGPLLVDTVMARHHRVCASHAGTRTRFVTWGRADRPCPAVR